MSDDDRNVRQVGRDGGAGARFPAWVYGSGTEPDPSFSLANERTYLAWVRTSLALVAGGVALEAFGLPLEPRLRVAASVLCLLLGGAVPVLAWHSWGRTEQAVRRGAPLPGSLLSPALAVGVALVAVLVLLALVVA